MRIKSCAISVFVLGVTITPKQRCKSTRDERSKYADSYYRDCVEQIDGFWSDVGKGQQRCANAHNAHHETQAKEKLIDPAPERTRRSECNHQAEDE
jgi:hypothetical protein